MILTQWFNPRNKEFPVHVGVYQRKFESGCVAYNYWNGYGWCFTGSSIDAAIRQRHDYSIAQYVLWRGLAK